MPNVIGSGSARASRAIVGALADIIFVQKEPERLCDGDGAIAGTRGRVRAPDYRHASGILDRQF